MSSQESVRTVLRASRLIDGTGSAPVDDPIVVIENGRIEAICCGELPANFAEGAAVIDLPGKTLLPGFIDAHVHLTFDAGPSHDDVRRRVATEDESYLLLGALHNAQALLSCGITTARDCGDRGYITFALRRVIAEDLFAGPRLICCGPPITTTGGHLHFCGNEVDTVDEIRHAVRSAVKRGVDFIKIAATGGMMTPGSNPRRAQYSVPELRAAVEESHRLGKRVAAHVLGTEGIAAALEAGVDTLEHCTWLSADGKKEIDFQPTLAREMARRNVIWSHTILGQHRALLPDKEAPEEEQAKQLTELRQEMERYRATLDAGARMMISTDAGVAQTYFENYVDSLEVAVLGMGVAPLGVIEACTRIPAEALGMADDIGTLVPGRRADIVVVEGDPSLDITRLRWVSLVMRDGQVVFGA